MAEDCTGGLGGLDCTSELGGLEGLDCTGRLGRLGGVFVGGGVPGEPRGSKRQLVVKVAEDRGVWVGMGATVREVLREEGLG